MGKSKNNGEKAKGEAGFHAYYAALFGGRWETLKAALSAEGAYAKLQCGGKEAYFLDAASVRAAAHLPLAGASKILDLCAAPGGKSLVLASLMDKDAALDCNERSFERKKSAGQSLRLVFAGRYTAAGSDFVQRRHKMVSDAAGVVRAHFA